MCDFTAKFRPVFSPRGQSAGLRSSTAPNGAEATTSCMHNRPRSRAGPGRWNRAGSTVKSRPRCSPAPVGSGRDGTGRLGSARVGSGRLGSGRAVSRRVEPFFTTGRPGGTETAARPSWWLAVATADYTPMQPASIIQDYTGMSIRRT